MSVEIKKLAWMLDNLFMLRRTLLTKTMLNTGLYFGQLPDLMYISNPNIIEDLRIIMATIKVLFLPESTEGVAEKLLVARAECALTKENEENRL